MLIILNVNLLTLMPINCRLLLMRGLLSMGMVVIQPCILVLKLKKAKTRFLHYIGYLNFIKKTHKARFFANSSSCTTTQLSKLFTSCLTAVKNTLLSTAKRYMKELIRIDYGQSKIQVKYKIKLKLEISTRPVCLHMIFLLFTLLNLII